MKFFIPLVFAVLALLSFPALAQQDSIDYMMDGEMTEAEMRAEAMGVYASCAQDIFRTRYFNCECVAGAFLKEREKRGPFIPQNDITMELYRDEGQYRCGNGEIIAATTYGECMEYSRYFRSASNNNAQYCECASNKMAKDFTAAPHISPQYINRLRVEAMLSCERRFPNRTR